MKARILLPAAAIVAVDQAVKAWMSGALASGRAIPVVPGLAWQLTHNTGAAFGVMSGGNARLIVASALAIAFILLWSRQPSAPVTEVSMGMLLGGAAGNLIDRVRLGHVIDFIAIQRHGQTIFPNFNVADSAITVGACLLAYAWFCAEPREPAAAPREPERHARPL